MSRYIIYLGMLLAAFTATGQTVEFLHGLGPKVFVGNDSLLYPWSGSLNFAQAGTLDFNADGVKDLLLFDRAGNRVLPMIQTAPGQYRFQAAWRDSLPAITNWVQTYDYNCDGKEDLFVSVPGGIMVYTNTSGPNGLHFTKALTGPWLTTTYGSGAPINLYVTSQDIPAITDLDGNNALDILTFGVVGTRVEHHQSTSPCGLTMALDTNCWGNFEENFSNNSVIFDACSGNLAPPPQGEKTQHTGSTLLALDLDGDADKDLILGDISFKNATAVFNGGSSTAANMTSQDTAFPSNSTPVKLYVFPSFFHLDINGDGKRDLVTSPNANGSENRHSVWYYLNTNTDASPVFALQQRDLFQSESIELGENAMPVLADLNGDGLQDLVVANLGFFQSGGNYRPAFHYYINTGTPTLAQFTLQDTNLAQVNTLGFGPRLMPAFGDLDGDGDADMILGDKDGYLHYFANTGTSSSPAFTLTIPQLGGWDVGNSASPHLHDLDNDGDLDLLVGEESGTLNLITNNGSPGAPSWSFITDRFGGINMRGIYGNGYSIPAVFEFAGRKMLAVGSRDRGILLADSLEQVLVSPGAQIASWNQGTQASTGNDITPMGSGKRTGRNQILLKASELKSKGLRYGKITSLSFQVASSNNFPLSNGITIGMKAVTMNQLSAFESGFQEVYNGIGSFSPGWNPLTFTTPFVWDGVSDLLIEVCFSRNIPNTTIDVFVHDAGFDANAYGDVTNWNTNAANGCQMPYKDATNLRPNLELGFIPAVRETEVIRPQGEFLSPAVGYFTQDSIPELLVGNVSGGVEFFTSKRVWNTVGVPETQLAQPHLFRAWPNPALNTLYFEFTQTDNLQVRMNLYDLQGRILRTRLCQEATGTWSLEGLPTGMYILEAQQGDVVQREKWLIRK